MIFLFLRCMGQYTSITYWRIKYMSKINISSIYNYDLIPAEKSHERINKLEFKVKELKAKVYELAMLLIDSNIDYRLDVDNILKNDPELYDLIKKEL